MVNRSRTWEYARSNVSLMKSDLEEMKRLKGEATMGEFISEMLKGYKKKRRN